MSGTSVEVVAAALRRRGCPICNVVRGMVFDELSRLQRQAVVDPATRADMVARGGFCAAHLRDLEHLASPLTMATLLAPLLERVAESAGAVAAEIAGGVDLLRRHPGEIADQLGAPRACPVCERVVVWEDAAVADLLAIASDPSGGVAYRGSDGLCLTHLTNAVRACGDPVLAQHLLEVAAEQTRRLASQLAALVRKRGERDRRPGAEDAAPRVAAQKLGGG
ncbi:hypothetical protein KF840_02570 [bacterium]|nr:hypothetical protein [bacterium]